MRFLVCGALNTAASYAIYWMLLPILPYAVAYTVSFFATVISGYTLNTRFVFRAPWSWQRLAAFPLVHLFNYAFGLGVVWLWVTVLVLDARVAPVVATLVGLPLNFMLTRLVVKQKQPGPGSP